MSYFQKTLEIQFRQYLVKQNTKQTLGLLKHTPLILRLDLCYRQSIYGYQPNQEKKKP